MSLVRSISGIRGIVGESLTPEILIRYTAAFAEYCHRRRIVIGYDGRITGSFIVKNVISTLLSMGCDVISLGIAPTPTIQIAVEESQSSGGISITASHNPIEWNGLKFIGPDGMFLDFDENQKLWDIADQMQWSYVNWKNIGNLNSDSSYLDLHIKKVVELPYINLDQICSRRFKVVLDCINASGGCIVPRLLKLFGCEVVPINCDVSGVFKHVPEPIPENLTELCQRVKEEGADFGIAVDPDVDRLVLVTEKGEPFGEEYTITTLVKFILEKQSSKSCNVVVNLSTTRAVDDIAKLYNAKVFRTPVGEINVAKKMKETNAIIGGEGSGGVILPCVHYGRDALVGIGLFLQQLTEFNGTVDELKVSLPRYTMLKSKINVAGINISSVFRKIIGEYDNLRINTEDGLKLELDSSSIHIRVSNTEPIVRFIAEAPTHEEAEDLIIKFKKYFH